VRFHVVGAGIAGLAAALDAADAGHDVQLYEAAPQAGGRCRSLDDRMLGRRIDNGSHVLIGANPHALGYLDRIGARGTLVHLGASGLPFADLQSGDAWIFRPGNLVPGVGLVRHLRALALVPPAGQRTVTGLLGRGPMVRRLWSPLTVAALNTAPDEASAQLLRRVAWEIACRGRSGLDLMMAAEGLSETFVDPALERLRNAGATIRFSARLGALEFAGGGVAALIFGTERIALDRCDRIVLAVGPQAAKGLIPDLSVPVGSNAVVNGHFLVEPAIVPNGSVPIMGICGATAHWLFQRGDVLSATASAANVLAAEDSETIARRLWHDIARALGLRRTALPPYRVVKEKRATFAQTPANEARRPGPDSGLANLALAGDWTATGLPASIECAVFSGRRAFAHARDLRRAQSG